MREVYLGVICGFLVVLLSKMVGVIGIIIVIVVIRSCVCDNIKGYFFGSFSFKYLLEKEFLLVGLRFFVVLLLL